MTTSNQGYAPLPVHVEVRQDPDRLRGVTVCVEVDGPEYQRSCWATERPVALVTRDFVLHTAGDYTVRAVTATERTKAQNIHVL